MSHLNDCADGEVGSCAAAIEGSAFRFFGPQRGRLHGLRSCPATAFGRWPARRACVRFRPRESQIRLCWSSPGTPAVGPRFARNSGPFRRTPAAVMQRPELIAALLPALRADLALVAGYPVEDRIACPITAFAGADDVTHSGSLQSWSDFTRGKFRTCIFPGGHFYFSPAAAALAKEIVQDLHASADVHAPDARS